jgi:hypothetical protein
MALEREFAAYEAKLPELKFGHLGRFVLVHGDDIVSIHDTQDDALADGYAKFGLEPFMVTEIGAKPVFARLD